MSIRVRQARPGNLEALVELVGLLLSQEEEFGADAARQRRALGALLAAPDRCRVVVAEAEGQVVGMVSIQLVVSTALGGTVGILEDMVVDPGHRGEGIGSLLLAAAIAQAEALGCLRLTLLTDAGNAGAQRLYERHGFRRSTMAVMRFNPPGSVGRIGVPGDSFPRQERG